MRVWYPNPMEDDVIEELRALVPYHEVAREPHMDAEMLIEGRATDKHMSAIPKVRAVVIPFAGVSSPMIQLVRSHPGVTLHNLHHNAPHTAELALALLFAAAKAIIPMDQAMRRHDWRPRYTPEWAQLLERQTCVILGYGNVGKRIGAVLEAVGMEVIGIRRRADRGNYGPDDLRRLLPRANVLMITIPLTDETVGMIGREELALMPDASILVNVARAQIVDEHALYEALRSRKLHSAGIDVWYRYPQEEGNAVPGYFVAPPSAENTPPSQFPFHELPNLVMSPHRGGATAGTEQYRVRALAEMIEAAASGKPIPNQVDLDRGY